MTEAATDKPTKGTYGDLEAYPKKVEFKENVAVVVTFPKDYKEPKEMPTTSGDGVYYIFPCVVDLVKSSISTSAWTLLKSLKTHEPLAGKTLIVTKKNIAGKNMFYVNVPDKFGSNELVKEPELKPDEPIDTSEFPNY